MNGFTLWKVKDEALPAWEGVEWILDRNDDRNVMFTSREEAVLALAAEGLEIDDLPPLNSASGWYLVYPLRELNGGKR